MQWVQVTKDDDNVGKIAGRLAVADYFGIIRLMKMQISVALESRIVAANLIDARDEVLQAPGGFEIPTLQFVLFGVEVLFAAGLPGCALAKLERRTVDPVVCSQGGGKNEADHEGGAPSGLEELRENVGRIGPKVRAIVFAHAGFRELLKIAGQLGLGIAPGEIRVGLRKANLGETIHQLRASKSFRQKQDFRVLTLNLGNHPFPKGKGLRVGIIDAEQAHTVLDPEQRDTLQFVPQLPPVGRLKVERENVLIFFRRIFRILDGAVRTLTKPFRMLPYIGVIGRALESQVKRDLDSVRLRVRDQPMEIFERSQLGVDTGMPAVFRADRPWTADVVRPRDDFIVPALARRASDGMNRRKIQNVETHRGDVREPSLAIPQCAVRGGLRGLGRLGRAGAE